MPPDPDGTEQVEAWDCAEGCPIAELDAQSGERGVHGAGAARSGAFDPTVSEGTSWLGTRDTDTAQMHRFGDSGGASRFFPTFRYQAKASRAERNAGLQGFEERDGGTLEVSRSGDTRVGRTRSDGAIQHQATPTPAANRHPTVKPLALMRWLVRLVTPPEGIVLDPFAGSGTTGCAAVLEGFDFIGIEREAEYVEIAEARIAHWLAEAEAEPAQLSFEEPAA